MEEREQKRATLDPAQQEQAIGDMDPDSFRLYAHQVVDWIADYLEHVGDYPVLARTQPGDIRRALPAQPPQQPESMQAILADFERILLPGITHWNAPGFMGFFGITGSGPGILGEFLTAALNVNAMLWRTSPAATELEQVALDWLRQMLGLPGPLFGVINDTASAGTLYALAAAREALSDLQIRQHGMSGRPEVPRLRYYASQEAHSAVDKAGIVLGVGLEGLRKIPVDEAYRMDVAALEQAIKEDLAAGWRPFAVVATVGTTSTTSVDPVPAIADLCERYGLWLHIDASYAGSAALLPEYRHILAGCERADSFIVNPHKWLFTPLDCSVFFTRKPDIVKATFSLVLEILRTDEEAPNLMDYGISLGRRFRALKLWMIMRYFGQEGLQARLREHIRLGQLLAHWIDEAPDFERLAPTPFSTVCFRAHPRGLDDEAQLTTLNERLLQRINSAGHYFLSHTRLRGRYSLRAAIGNLRTTEETIRGLWQELQEGLRVELARLS
ncbi:pyridoxal phosphate-dependent decarboxylase family protein [Thermogemmatispora sp.]|uniref:pyridoxal phosphate-dependent decarboxylase family protein n=3 Tax=Thermogemmatispora sp. TaxID=1968838 RepID=UPI002ACC2BA2|nr:pyridoxal-dependent decarboxylase [Thermogemmatispora sp.]